MTDHIESSNERLLTETFTYKNVPRETVELFHILLTYQFISVGGTQSTELFDKEWTHPDVFSFFIHRTFRELYGEASYEDALKMARESVECRQIEEGFLDSPEP